MAHALDSRLIVELGRQVGRKVPTLPEGPPPGWPPDWPPDWISFLALSDVDVEREVLWKWSLARFAGMHSKRPVQFELLFSITASWLPGCWARKSPGSHRGLPCHRCSMDLCKISADEPFGGAGSMQPSDKVAQRQCEAPLPLRAR